MLYLFDVHPNHRDVRELCKDDPILEELVHRIGRIQIPRQSDGFTYIVRTLVGQQLSIKAAATIYQRLEQICGTITPDTVLTASEESLRSAGLSRNKLSYLLNLAEQTKLGALNFELLANMNDEEVIRQLTLIKGVGRWTAEMFLIFYFGRANILSFGDLGLKRASEWLYAEETSDGPSVLQRKQEVWGPHSTIASLYLWEAINIGLLQSGPFRTPLREV
ncbi:DNA-3-methyladenine glycosylase family protein [Paenibacillus segetis]|uniref:DNA-3-methyladenine glycosylase II n=1 Tax=Paenibacillus segetis TaxID=1325360 RepID=A0ABQ1YDF7_9BACL|nr:DNA-3-methyladenine glycosylase 2 family protein [Paenibacillus segetis]GGH20397.1 DNA-3-methyladenine glycosylase II [Paenibacillus segetis]